MAEGQAKEMGFPQALVVALVVTALLVGIAYLFEMIAGG